MSRNERIALVVGVVVVAVVAFVIAKGGGNDNSKKTASSGTRNVSARITIRGGRPVGGIHTISAMKGSRIRLVVTTSDTKNHVHVHGYDILKPLAPGKPATFSFKATIEGVFEAELEDTKTQIAKLSVKP
jgi:heme/copper-type cytochrome/quinol oxidase subunit 2